MKSYRAAALFMFAAATAGCGWSGSDDVAPLVTPAAAAPESFPFSGTTWTRTAAPSDDDWNVLKLFFQQYPNYADSADFAGEPFVFRSNGSDRMFIWTQPAVQGSRWQLVRRQGGRFFQDFGEGVPWTAAAVGGVE